MAREITDSTFIRAVGYTYRKKRRPVTSNEVVAEILRRRKEKVSRFTGIIVRFEVASKLNELADKHKIKRVVRNRKEYFMPR